MADWEMDRWKYFDITHRTYVAGSQDDRGRNGFGWAIYLFRKPV